MYNLINSRFLHHLWTKVSQLIVPLMMLALQFSSKMLKNLKERAFCREVLLAKRQLFEKISWKDKLCLFCELPAWWKSTQTPLLTNTERLWKHWKGKFYLFCEFLGWWKSTQRLVLTKVRDFERSESWTTWKCKLYLFFETPAWWKLFKFLFWQK